MKTVKITFAALALLLSAGAMAQQTTNVVLGKATGNSQVVAPVQPVEPVRPAPAPVNYTEKARKSETAGANGMYNNPSFDRSVSNTTPGQGRPVGHDLKNAEGMIRIDFGVAMEGATVNTFFPFNIVTLQNEETEVTPVIQRSDYIRYTPLSRETGVTDVKLANGMKFRRGVSAMSGNGFDLAYLASKPGAVDEVVQVYTKKGNIMYRLTGYVAAKGTSVSVR
ncbi:hypothetical protein [Taibaiella chishuiensis]|uniref:Uncharacterized protein n=1 Tax=Taibaiella chishuiensis TaxID=1434707 RepID=A0A2P8DDB2_9BACT|nr:hypothetical protein [Taibaiella chishuiensis]PSK95206.1 hypothetical protein B0I18_1011372 [Taibaiella chishuiensis]